MAKENLKSLALTKSKVAAVDGEHQITFVASTNSEDRDYEHVAIGTFRLPLKGGGHIVVQDIPTGGVDNVDIPLLTDHDLYSVAKTIGSVREAVWDVARQSLIFKAGISSRPYAQEMFTLVQEGHLDNAFSIQYRDYDHDPTTDTDSNGEVVEVSLVTRGSNMDARVISTKALKGKDVEDEKPTTVDAEAVKVEEATPAEAPKEEAKAEEKPAEAPAKEEKAEEKVAEEPAKEEAPAPAEEKPAEEETPIEAAAEVADNAKSINEDKEKSMSKQAEVAKTLVKEATQTKSADNVVSDYLKTKAAVRDFAQILKENKGDASIKAWANHCAEKGVTGDTLLPSRIEQVFFETWENHGGILSTFRRTTSRHFAANAFYGSGENIRAKGHKKGEEKAEQIFANKRRDLSVKVIYKMLPLDWQDILDDEDGTLLEFRTRELAERVADEVAIGAIVGDGRSAPSGTDPDYRVFDGARGLYSIAGDLNGSAAAGSYASMVASTIANDADDTMYAKIVKALDGVKTKQGQGKVVVVPEHTIAQLQLITGENGGYLFQPGTDFSLVFGAKIFELPGVQEAGYDVIAYADQGYVLTGTDDVIRADYDITHNKDVMLVERAVAGSLNGYKAACGYKAAATSA